MKKVIMYSYLLTINDVKKSVENGWVVSTYKKQLCLENSKTIFVPVYMPKM